MVPTVYAGAGSGRSQYGFGIAPRPCGRAFAELHRPDLDVGGFGHDRQADRTAAGAQVDDAEPRLVAAPRRQPIQPLLHHKLGFGPRDEHARADGEVEVAERGVADDVLQRLPCCTTGKHGVEAPLGNPLYGGGGGNAFRGVFLRKGCNRLPQQHGLVHVAETATAGFGQQQFGVMFGGVHTGVAQRGRRATDGLFDVHQLWRARRSASSAWMSESMTACRSPSST